METGAVLLNRSFLFIKGVFTMAKRFYYGGQAVIEGVMMRGEKTMVTVVRRPNGELATDIHPLAALYTGWMRKTPLIRGIIVLIEALALGIKSLLYSANVSLEEEDTEFSGGFAWTFVILAMVLGVALFFMAHWQGVLVRIVIPPPKCFCCQAAFASHQGWFAGG